MFKKQYDVIRTADDEVIGRVDLTLEEWERYRALAEQKHDQLTLAEIPHAISGLHEQWQHLGPNTTAHLD
ncbi:MAG: hypothetical protein AB7U20_04045 [Planctomycetaceae bacterium]